MLVVGAGLASCAIMLFQLAIPAMVGGLRGTNVGGYSYVKRGNASWLYERTSPWATDVHVAAFGRARDSELAKNERRPPQLGRLAEFRAGPGGVMQGYRLITFGMPLRMLMAELVVEPELDEAGERTYKYRVIGGTRAQGRVPRVPEYSYVVAVIPTKIMWLPLCGNLIFWWTVCASVTAALSGIVRSLRGCYRARDGRCRSCGHPVPGGAVRCPECGRQAVL